MATFMGNDPKTGGDEPGGKAIQGPEGVPGEVVKKGMGQRDVDWGDVLFDGDRGMIDES